MSRVIAFPFSITPAGTVATVEQGTDEEADQVLRVILSTLLDERPMAPTFGVPDPTFIGIDTSDVMTVLNDYEFTDIRVVGVSAIHPTETTQQVALTWERDDDGGTLE